MEYARHSPGRGFRPWHSLLYYGQRIVVMPWMRDRVVQLLQRYVRLRTGKSPSTASGPCSAHLSRLRIEGYTPLGQLLTATQLHDIRAFLRDKPLTTKQAPGQRFVRASVPPDVRMADYAIADVVDCPHILALANSPELANLAAAYIGCKPTLSALGLRWSFPGQAACDELQTFHRDVDDWRFFKVFVYLTDVDVGAGPHVYVSHTHITPASMRLELLSDGDVSRQFADRKVHTITGESGFGFAVDTYGIHKGMPPTDTPRLMLTIQYSLLPNYLYKYRPLRRPELVGFDRYSNRLFLQN
ncbi:hypothetical protein SAMN06265795_10748 [Noviherbaspirillum humi]|uniref:Phytanoyl-CoA dioxygenase (PhyH) n=1 Tax=Noviherbaspirillum humi TaxID=1688639 RepID=A0A239HL84_9BURK|nr:hypothetical protein [Noviherbaspirillum humi]SNS82097.1 hypothetical protein SAMN06265795_10748 [Noviherbaspirillum humi]